jgi:hypothetical protein
MGTAMRIMQRIGTVLRKIRHWMLGVSVFELIRYFGKIFLAGRARHFGYGVHHG